jgi:outer membrane protein TolC
MHIRHWRVECTILASLAVLCSGPLARAQQAETPRKLSLKEAVGLAVRNSRDIALARLQYTYGKREAGVTRSAFLPNLYTGTGAAYTSGFPLLAGGGVPAVFSLSYEQQIFNPPLKGDERGAEERAEEQQLGVDGVRDAVMERAALRYLNLAKVRHGLELMRSEQQSAQRILDATRQQAQAGRALPIEVTRAQLTVARIDQRLAQLEDQDDDLTAEMVDMMGLPSGEQIEVSSEQIPEAATDQVDQLVAQAMANNTELKQAEAERRAREFKLKGERGGYWPTVSITGQYNVLGKFNNYSSFFNKFERNNVVAGVEVRIPIFAARTSSAVALAQAGVKEADLDLQKKRSRLSLEVRRQARQVHEADLGVNVARLELQLAQENLSVLQAQYDQGRATLEDLENAHLNENDKWMAYLNVNYSRQQAQLNLLRSTGEVASVLQ